MSLKEQLEKPIPAYPPITWDVFWNTCNAIYKEFNLKLKEIYKE